MATKYCTYCNEKIMIRDGRWLGVSAAASYKQLWGNPFRCKQNALTHQHIPR